MTASLTRIQSLFLVRASFEVANNEDWLDAIAFLDGQSAPIPLDGLTIRAIGRTARDSTAAHFGLATPGATLDLASSTPRGVLLIGGADRNVLAFSAPFSRRDHRPPGGTYVFDVVAAGDGLTRRIVDGDLTLIEGITR